MTEKTLHNSDASGARKNVPDIEFFGDGDLWELLSKASSQKEGWMKSTKAMSTLGGCLVQVSTQQRNPDGSYSLAEALTFVPGVIVNEQRDDDENIIARYLVGVPLTAGIAQGAFLGAQRDPRDPNTGQIGAPKAGTSIGEEMTEMGNVTRLGAEIQD